MVRVPSSPEVLRRVAMLFDAPIQEVLIASGYMTEEEAFRWMRRRCPFADCPPIRFLTNFASAEAELVEGYRFRCASTA